MTGYLDDFMANWFASFNFATTVFLVEWLVIFFVQSSGKQLGLDFIISLMQHSPIWDLAYYTLVVGLGSIAKYRGPEFFTALSWCFNHSKSLTGSLFHRRMYTTFVGRALGFICQSPCLVLLEFLWTEPFCLHLPFAKWWSLLHTHCRDLDSLWTPCVPTDFWSWGWWGHHHCDILIYLQARKFLFPLYCKAELC